jgi:hypothetical protein
MYVICWTNLISQQFIFVLQRIQILQVGMEMVISSPNGEDLDQYF